MTLVPCLCVCREWYGHDLDFRWPQYRKWYRRYKFPQYGHPGRLSVKDDATLYLSFDPQVTTAMAWHYSGLFVKPDIETQPSSTNVEYPGGSAVVTSSAGTNGIVWGAGSVQSTCYPYGAGALYACGPGTLAKLWATVDLNPVPVFSLASPAFNAMPAMRPACMQSRPS